jgi:uncharacterized membrane protein YgdD (TMEM256/DUF423 family)
MTLFHVAGVAGFFGVALGAFGAHGLRSRGVSPELLEVWKTGVLYHLVHALALLGVAAAGERLAWPRLTGGLFLAGILIFSGSLYALTLSGARLWGAVTPVGGLAFLAGWLALAVGVRAR